MKLVIAGSRRDYGDFIGHYHLDKREHVYIGSDASARGYHDMDVLFGPRWQASPAVHLFMAMPHTEIPGGIHVD